jgi:hypothetical protein
LAFLCETNQSVSVLSGKKSQSVEDIDGDGLVDFPRFIYGYTDDENTLYIKDNSRSG